MANRGSTRWTRILAMNAGGALVAFGMALGSESPAWPRFLDVLVKSLVYTNCVGTLAAVAIPPAVRRYGGHGVSRFLIRVGGIAAAIVVGIAAGAVILLGVGVIRTDEFLAYAVPTDWPVYVYPTMLMASLGISYYQTMSEQLSETTIALRTKERDEARARQLVAEAELAALEARVEPHFLFNALNSIAAMIPEDALGAERMVERVSALMRSSLETGGPPTSTLGEELRLVEAYLEVEHVRFGDRLRYELHVEPGAESLSVPRLSVQTLVENAVKYAVAARRGGATIVIRASMNSDRAHVSVTDDGPGFGKGGKHDGHGLALLRARIETVFGPNAALNIESRDGATTAAMDLPVKGTDR